jgi:hypothetical protein
VNNPAHPIAAKALSPDYEKDGYGWAYAQADLLRERRWDLIDLENIIEEIESVGRSEEDAAESALRVLMMHILKWQLQPERRGRSWALSIANQRLRYAQRMKKNPSLKSKLEDMRTEAFRRSRIEAAQEMDVPLKTITTEPLGWDVILEEPFEVD